MIYFSIVIKVAYLLGLIAIAILIGHFLVNYLLPKNFTKTQTQALSFEEARTTSLGRVIAPEAQAHPEKTGVIPLSRASDAFAARALLAEASEKTLDLQYYIWRRDTTGELLLNALYQAAERGVRVRLLLDDNGTRDLDDYLSYLNQHPNIEVRLFNPFVLRKARWLNFITDFPRLNRRMHNKVFIADNEVAIIGGRNIGNEYFGAKADYLFNDLDVLSIGEVVGEVSTDFDKYWASLSSYPFDLIVKPNKKIWNDDDYRNKVLVLEQSDEALEFIEDIEKTKLVERLLDRKIGFEWSHTKMVSDHPSKGLGLAKSEKLMTYQLIKVIGYPKSHLLLVSPYFVPTQRGTDHFVKLANQGIRISILTNSLEATNVAAVHSGYAKHRKTLLKAGIEVYEMKRFYDDDKHEKKLGLLSGSAASLHAKTFAVDSERLFVGSFNFDPRSAHLNTELGFIIESEPLTIQIENAFIDMIPDVAYKVELDEDDNLYWVETLGEHERRYHTEPNAGWFKCLQVRLLSYLPIEALL